MAINFYKKLVFILSVASLFIIAATVLFAAIDFRIKPENKTNLSHSEIKMEQSGNKTEVSKNKTKVSKKNISKKINSNKRKIVIPKKNEKLIQGFRTTKDAKGNEKNEYVYGVVKKGKNSIYTGYLYGEKNKPTLVYGDPSTGSLQEQNQGTVSVDSEKPYNAEDN